MGDELGKTATKLGLTAEALAGLQFAAQQSGVNVRTFNMGLQRMIRRVAEAAIGTGEAKDALKQLGIEVKSLSLKSADKQFLAIAAALSRVEGQSERVRLAFKLFDSEGVALVNLAQRGDETIVKLMRDTVRFGTALTKIDVSTLEMANDALGLIGERFKGLRLQIGAGLAPLIVVIGEAFSNMLGDVSTLGLTLARVLKKGFDVLSPGFRALATSSKEMGINFDAAFFRIDEATGQAKALNSVAHAWKVTAKDAATAWNPIVDVLERMQDRADDFKDVMADISTRTLSMANAIRGTGNLRTAGQLGVGGVGGSRSTSHKFLGLQQRVVTLLERIERKTGSRGLR